MRKRSRMESQLHAVAEDGGRGFPGGQHGSDFNNILTAILGNAELARTPSGATTADTSEALPEIKAIQSAAERAAALTRQLLMFAQQGDGEAEVRT
jgi:signal transduction histidine kinase